jgi:two-component system C4-dicarboxylate transport response regulator DctD
MRVMLVDDEADIVYILRKGLALKGFEVHAFTDPGEALARFVPNHYDAILTDIKMPYMTGLELYQEIRKQDPSVRVYFLSAFEAFAAEIRDKLSGDSELVRFIKKPTTYSALAETLQRGLEKKRVTV